MSPIVIGAPAAYTLVQLATLILQNEGLFGPLIDMGNDSNQSTFTFDQDQAPPANNAVLTLQSDPAPVNATEIVSDRQIFVAGTLTACRASRPN
jgi:hypothetical protein